jgi:hypothetical protein
MGFVPVLEKPGLGPLAITTEGSSNKRYIILRMLPD